MLIIILNIYINILHIKGYGKRVAGGGGESLALTYNIAFYYISMCCSVLIAMELLIAINNDFISLK